MTYNEFTYNKLNEIPLLEWSIIDKNKYDSVIIVPMMDQELHDSGFRCLTYLFCEAEEILCRSIGRSDVLHINGIGGYGQSGYATSVKPAGWTIDCLPNGYLRIFCNKKIINGNGISDYVIFCEEENDNANK